MIEHSESYWNDLLDQYKSGNISEEDRYELEKHALDDPFLFDALEGYELYGDSDRVNKPKSKLFTFPRIAAAASIIFLVSMIFLLKDNNTALSDENQPIAMVLDSEDLTSSKVGDKNSNEPVSEEETSEIAIETILDDQVIGTNEKVKQVNTVPNNQKKEDTKSSKRESVSTVANSKIPLAASSTKAESSFQDRGSEDEIMASAKENLESIDVSSGSPMVPAGNKENLSSILEESADISVSNDAEMKTRKKADEVNTFYKVEPEIGKRDFDDFVKQRIDALNLRQTPTVETVIEFTINPDGSIGEFTHIVDGGDECSSCGAQAIALLKQSGVWRTIPAGNTGRARYKFKF